MDIFVFESKNCCFLRFTMFSVLCSIAVIFLLFSVSQKICHSTIPHTPSKYTLLLLILCEILFFEHNLKAWNSQKFTTNSCTFALWTKNPSHFMLESCDGRILKRIHLATKHIVIKLVLLASHSINTVLLLVYLMEFF